MSKSNRNRQASTKPFTANLPACLVFGFFQIRNSTTKRARNGMANASTRTRLITMTISSFDRIALASLAARATSRRIQAIRLPIRKTRAGKISRQRLAISTSTKEKSLPVMSRRADFFTKCWPPSRAALPTLRGSRPITSIIRMQSTQSFCWQSGNASQNSRLRKK